MATLAFEVQADYDKVIRLRTEIQRLEKALDSMQGNGSKEAISELEAQLSSARQEMQDAVAQASQLGNSLDAAFKSGTVDRVTQLSYAIKENEQAIAQGALNLKKWKQDAEEAFKAGDTGTLEAITADIKQQTQEIQELAAQTEGYRLEQQRLITGGQQFDTSLSGVRSMLEQVAVACQTQENEIARLTTEYEKLALQYSKTTKEGSKEEAAIQKRLQVIQGEIAVRKGLLAELREQSNELETEASKMEVASQETEKLEEKQESLRAQIKALKQEMADMRMNGVDEQSEAYKRLVAELGRLQDIQGDISRQGQILANDERALAGITSGLQGVAGGFTAAQNAIAIFSGSNEELQAVMSKTYAIMAIVNGLQQVSAMLNKDSAFRLITLVNLRKQWNNLLAIGRGEEIADTVATTANTAAQTANNVAKQASVSANTQSATATSADTVAKSANTVATTANTTASIGLAGAFRMVAAAIKGIVASIPVFGWVVAGFTAIVGVVSHFTKKAKEAKKAAEEMYKTLSEQAYQPIGAIKQLQTRWNALGDDLKAKEKFIEENKEQFEALGISINNVKDAENLLIGNAEAFIQAQITKAKATVMLNKAMDGVKELTEMQAKLDDTSDYNEHWYGRTWTGAKEKLNNDIKEKEKEINDLFKMANDYETDYQKQLEENGIKKIDKSSSSDNATKSASETEKQLKKEKDLTDEVRKKQQKEELRAIKDREFARREAEIEVMKAGNEKTLAQIRLDYDKQRELINREEEDLKEKKISRERELWQANPNNKDKEFDAKSVDTSLTDDESAYFDAQRKKIEALHKGMLESMHQKEVKSFRDFLKEYGTYEQKREAIAAEYEEKIAKAETMAEKMTLSAQKNEALQTLDFQFKDSTNWEALFTNIDKYSVDFLKELQGKLRDLLKSDDITAEQAKVMGDQLSRINQLILQKSQSWKDVLGFTSQRQKEYNALLQAEGDARDRLEESQNRYEKSLESTKAIAGELVSELKNAGLEGFTADNVLSSTADIRQTLQDSGVNEDLIKRIDDLLASLGASQEQTSKNEEAVKENTDALTVATKAREGAEKKTKEEKKNDAIDNAQMLADSLADMGSLADMFGLDEGIGKAFNQLSQGVNSSIDAFKAFTSGDYVGAAVSAVSAVSSIGDVIGGLFGLGESDKTLHKDMESLSYSNQALKNSIDALSSAMSRSTTSLTEATEDYATAKANLEQMESDMASIMYRAGESHSRAIFSSDHSSNYYVNKNMTAEDWEAVSKAAGRSVTSASDFWTLTSQEMYNVSVDAAAQYAKIKQYADDGHDDVSQYMDEYISYYQQLNQLQSEYKEKLTATSFSSITDSFKSALMDMEHSAADWADDFEDMMKEAVISGMLSDTYNKRLAAWYEDFKDAMESDSTLTAQEQEDLKNSYMKIVDDATQELDSLYEMMGWSKSGYSQSGSQGGFNSMSEDTAQELNGRFTALQEAGYGILDSSLEGGENLRVLLGSIDLGNSRMASIEAIGSEARQILSSSFLELQEIADNTQKSLTQLLLLSQYMKAVRDNTDKL